MPFELPKVFVKPGKGVRVPLPLPGGLGNVPKEGREVIRSVAIERLITSKDLVEANNPAEAPVPEPKAEPAPETKEIAAAETAAKKG